MKSQILKTMLITAFAGIMITGCDNNSGSSSNGAANTDNSSNNANSNADQNTPSNTDRELDNTAATAGSNGSMGDTTINNSGVNSGSHHHSSGMSGSGTADSIK